MKGHKDTKEASKFDLVKTIGYVIVIVLIFSPLTFLVSNTITGTVENDCYLKIPSPSYEVKTNQSDYQRYDQEIQECQQAYDLAQKNIDHQQFFIVSIISIVTIIALLFFSSAIDSVISYSLFFAASLNTIIIVIKNSSSSYLATGLGVILFILVLIFINKNLKK